MKEASYYSYYNDNIKCKLCMHGCEIPNMGMGFCRSRVNINNKLYAKCYEFISSINLDPIEKKPLYKFHPKKKILSIGSYGCNMRCMFCQNHEISQNEVRCKSYSSEDLLDLAKSYKDNIGIAFTYNEPLINYEFVFDTFKLFKYNNLETVLVTNGMINNEPLVELLKYTSALNIDFKGFSDEVYIKLNGNINVVKNTIIKSYKSCYIELTSLIIPGVNDDKHGFEDFVKWISSLSKDIVLHLTRYYPKYKLNIEATPIELLKEFKSIADKYLNYVYLGNC